MPMPFYKTLPNGNDQASHKMADFYYKQKRH